MIKFISGILLISNVSVFFYLFIRILIEGYVYVQEPNAYILGAELVMAVLIIVFSIYLVLNGLREGWEKKKKKSK